MLRLEILGKWELINGQTEGSLIKGIAGIGHFVVRPFLGLRFSAAATAAKLRLPTHRTPALWCVGLPRRKILCPRLVVVLSGK